MSVVEPPRILRMYTPLKTCFAQWSSMPGVVNASVGQPWLPAVNVRFKCGISGSTSVSRLEGARDCAITNASNCMPGNRRPHGAGAQLAKSRAVEHVWLIVRCLSQQYRYDNLRSRASRHMCANMFRIIGINLIARALPLIDNIYEAYKQFFFSVINWEWLVALFRDPLQYYILTNFLSVLNISITYHWYHLFTLETCNELWIIYNDLRLTTLLYIAHLTIYLSQLLYIC